MKVRITEYTSKDKVFELAKYIQERYPLLIDMKIKFDNHEQLMLYLTVDDETVEEAKERYEREQIEKDPDKFGGPVTDEDIPF